MNAYEQKQEAKRERLERAAERAREEAKARFERADAAVAGIPMGQPILVGHHSEKRHRAALNRSDANMRKGFEATERANELASRAESVGTGGISSDDPDALPKLHAQLHDHAVKRDQMKQANAHYRKHKTMRGFAGLDDEGAARIDARIAEAYSWEKQPFPKWQLSNLGANIRRIEQRIKLLEQRARVVAAIDAGVVSEQAPQDYSGPANSAHVRVDTLDNRVLLSFTARLPREQYKQVRRYGFLWSPTRNAFVRKLSSNAIYAAQQVAKQIVNAGQPSQPTAAVTQDA